VRWLNWLALDAVAVAVAWLGVFGKMTGARLEPVNAGVLGAAVWLIYMVDRWTDGKFGQGTAERHQFAKRQTAWLLPVILAGAVGAAAWAVADMRWITVKAGLGLSVGVGLYFMMLVASRWKQLSGGLLLVVSALMVVGLVQGEDHGSAGAQLWRAMAAGTLVTTLYFGMKHHFDPPPWTLVKKGVGGYLFALGVALGPFSHLQDWDGLLRGAPVVLFGGACALNSLGIRLWEHQYSKSPEIQLLTRLYPWLLASIGVGALAQSVQADEWSRPVLVGVALCAAGFAGLHLLRKRWPAGWFGLVADGWMVVVAVGVRFLGK